MGFRYSVITKLAKQTACPNGYPHCKHSENPWRFGKARILNRRESKGSLSFHYLRHHRICQIPQLHRMVTPHSLGAVLLLC